MLSSIFNSTVTRNTLSAHQSGFRPGYSCVHQLISIVHDIYNVFDTNPSLEVRGVFLDISKAFDRVWHDIRVNYIQLHAWVYIEFF